jgi:enamine deaminase RidA (YjgF/YER057c/UK114 family)
MAILHEGRRTIHVSGTASIESSGASSHLGDSVGQARQTLRSVEAVLAEWGAGWPHVVQATCFCKNPPAAEALSAALRRLGDARPPAVFMRADVCRPELLVEIEAIAVI